MTEPIFIFKRQEAKVPKTNKLQKSATRPRDVDAWHEYGSPAEAIGEAVAGAHDSPDEEELNAEVAEIRAQNPGIGSFAAHVLATRGRVAKADPVDALADSLVELHTEARKANMTGSQRMTLATASRKAEAQYLRSARPWAAADEVQVRKAEDGDALIAKAEGLRRVNPKLGRFEAMRRAARVA